MPRETLTQFYFKTHLGLAFREKAEKHELTPSEERLSHVRVKKTLHCGGWWSRGPWGPSSGPGGLQRGAGQPGEAAWPVPPLTA